MKKYYFSLLRPHSDIFIRKGGEKFGYNWGYTYHLRLPSILYLYVLQVSEKNLFSDFKDFRTEKVEGRVEGFDKCLESIMRIRKELPLSIEEFNNKIHLDNPPMASFTNGLNNLRYDWRLDDDKLRLFMKFIGKDEEKEIFILDTREAKILLECYLEFLAHTEKMIHVRGSVEEIIRNINEL